MRTAIGLALASGSFGAFLLISVSARGDSMPSGNPSGGGGISVDIGGLITDLGGPTLPRVIRGQKKGHVVVFRGPCAAWKQAEEDARARHDERKAEKANAAYLTCINAK